MRLVHDNAVGKLADDRGGLAVLALDHGLPLVELLEGLGRDAGAAAQRSFKRDVVDTVGRDATAVLLDPDVSVQHVVATGAIGPGVGLIVRIEADGYDVADGLRRSQLIAGLGAEGALARGADAAKVMVFVRPDREDLDGHAASVTRAALADCRAHGLPCVIEAMTYRLDGESEAVFAARRGDLIREAAVLLEACGAELLKLEYPGSAAGCAAVTDAVEVPWAVLSAGVGHDEFVGQLAASLDGGACGFIAGRSLWKESAAMDGTERRAYLDGVVRRRFAELVELLDAAS